MAEFPMDPQQSKSLIQAPNRRAVGFRVVEFKVLGLGLYGLRIYGFRH